MNFFRRHYIKRRYLLVLCTYLLIFCCLTGSFLTSCSFGTSQTRHELTNDTEAFDDFSQDLFCTELKSNTMNLHFTLAHPENYGITNAPITLGTISAKASATENASVENTKTLLDGYDYSSLTKKQQLTYDILSDYLTTELTGAGFYLYNEYLNPSSGVQSQLPVLFEEYRFYDEQDVKDYLALLPLTKKYFEEIISFEKEKAAAGLFMPDKTCDSLIAQCADFTLDLENHYLIKTFDKKIASVPSLSNETRAAYQRQNAKIVRDYIFPAYDELSAALSELKGRGKNDKGLCYFDKGKDYYKYLVYYNTGSSLSIEEMEAAIIGQRAADLSESSSLIKENPGLWSQSEQAALTDMDASAVLSLLQERMQKNFPKAPATEYTVSYIDECMQDYLAPAYYITAPIDNYKQNSIFINAATDSSSLRYFTTLAHEGFPGHLYQTVMSYEAGMAPVRCILNYPGYVEGWATYVEMLSYQYAGLDEKIARLMSLNQSALLSLYASTDIGIHYDGWSYSDTAQFWKNFGIENQSAIADVYQYILSEPGNYLKYYVGYLEFLKLKNDAKETYGSYYSDIAFHKAVLDIGPAPFAIVKKYLNDYYSPEDF